MVEIYNVIPYYILAFSIKYSWEKQKCRKRVNSEKGSNNQIWLRSVIRKEIWERKIVDNMYVPKNVNVLLIRI